MRIRRSLMGGLLLTAAGAVSLSSQGQPSLTPAEQRPTFRTGVNYVRVDVYPTASGQIVRDLRPEDFEVREDGTLQKLDSARFIDPGPPTPQAVRVEPNSVAESRAAAADPRARLFIIFIDTYHLRWTSTVKAHNAFVEMLGQSMGEHDLVGVMTPEMSAASVTFGRRTTVIEEILQRHFDLSRTPDSLDLDPEDRMYLGCYGPGGPGEAMISRRHETLTLDALKDLVNFVGGIREERKAIFFLSDGWVPTRADQQLANWTDGAVPEVKKPSVGPDGRLRAGGTQWENGGANRRKCDQERIRLAGEDHQAEFQRLLDLSNRQNATFYSVDLRGLVAPLSGANTRGPVGQEMLKTLSSATDGVAVVDTNDLVAGMRRALEDMRGYYLLGYYSTNAKADGTFRSIKVSVKRPGVSVRARRGYLAATQKEMKEAAAATPASGPPATAAPSTPTSEVAGALSALSRIGRETVVRALAGFTWRTGADGAPQASLWVAGEFDAASVARLEQWDAGADVSIDVIGPGGSPVDGVRQTLTRESRSFVVRLPAAGAVGPGTYDVRLTSKAASAALGTTQALQVVVPAAASGDGAPIGQPSLFRRGPYTGPDWVPVADLRFRRQERVKIEAAIVGGGEPASARLLDRTGSLLPLPLASSERQEGGARIVSGEVALAPLSPGEYLLEIAVGTGSAARRVIAAFRIIP
jgi:VWFA-related protein